MKNQLLDLDDYIRSRLGTDSYGTYGKIKKYLEPVIEAYVNERVVAARIDELRWFLAYPTVTKQDVKTRLEQLTKNGKIKKPRQ